MAKSVNKSEKNSRFPFLKKVCDFNASRDLAPVEPVISITFEDMLVSGVVPPDIELKDFNDVGDNPNVIVGRVSNVFQALRVKNYILSNPAGAVSPTDGASAPASSAPVVAPAASSTSAGDNPQSTSSSSN